MTNERSYNGGMPTPINTFIFLKGGEICFYRNNLTNDKVILDFAQNLSNKVRNRLLNLYPSIC